jgi:hypothetical protein
MTADELLRGLLPRIYWERDDGVLEALIGALADEYRALHAHVDALYDDFFIETCRELLVPYIGAGIGVSAPAAEHNRAWTGRVVAFRRRKGTLAAAARAAAAATGWAILTHEGFERTAHTQSMLAPRPDRGRISDLSASDPVRGVDFRGRLVAAGTPQAPGWTSRGGFPAPQAIQVEVWRLQSFPVTRRRPKPLDGWAHGNGGRFTFHPAGLDAPLFSVPRTPADSTLPPTRRELPLPLSVADLHTTLSDGGVPPVSVWRKGAPVALTAGDLGEWRAPAGEAVVDPVRGRLLLPAGGTDDVQVSYAYGAPGELGGGPYGYARSSARPRAGTRVLYVAREHAEHAHRTLEDALLAAAELEDTLILICDSATYRPLGGTWRVRLTGSRSLRIASLADAAPVLDGELAVHVEPRARLELSGMLVLGTLLLEGDGQLAIDHATLSPLRERSLVADGAPAIALTRVITGTVDAGPDARMAVDATIVDGGGGDALGIRGRGLGELDARQVTVLGSTTVGVIVAEHSVFAGPVHARRPNAGLVRSSSLAPGSTPAVRLGGEHTAARPRFTSVRWGDPAYGQLQLRCPPEISAGAARGGELGAYGWLGQPARMARLPVVLHEMLPAGIAASVEYRN